MEQLAAAIEIRLQSHEAGLEAVRGELESERQRGDALEEVLGSVTARLRHSLDDAAALRMSVSEQGEAQDKAWRAAAEERAALRLEIEVLRAGGAEAEGRERAEGAAMAERIGALQELQAQARAAASSEAAELRQVPAYLSSLLTPHQPDQSPSSPYSLISSHLHCRRRRGLLQVRRRPSSVRWPFSFLGLPPPSPPALKTPYALIPTRVDALQELQAQARAAAAAEAASGGP